MTAPRTPRILTSPPALIIPTCERIATLVTDHSVLEIPSVPGLAAGPLTLVLRTVPSPPLPGTCITGVIKVNVHNNT